MDNAYLKEVASKFDISDKKVLRKAHELLKLIATQKTVSCSESCKAVACLELASTLVGLATVSRENAIKYSGCKKSVYINMFNIISKVLNLDKVYSVKELCLALGVSEIETTAVNLLEKYKTSENLSKEELQHPMYPCAAILAACKSNKIRINISKFVELSRLKRTELEDLALTLEKHESKSLRTLQTKRKSSEADSLPANGIEKQILKKHKHKTEEEAEEEFQEWKKRMLAE